MSLPRPAFLAFLASLSLLCVSSRTSEAQTVPKKPRQFVCTPPNCPGPPAPTVSISPGTETTYANRVPVTITLCDSVSVVSDTVYQNGSVITSAFAKTQLTGTGACAAKFELAGFVALSGTATIRAVAVSTRSNLTQTGEASVTYTYAPPTTPPARGVRVQASAGQVTVPPSSSITETFFVTNTGAVTDTFALTATCTGAALVTHPPCTMASHIALTANGVPLTVGQRDSVTITSTTQSIVGPNGQLSLLAVSHASSAALDSASTVTNVFAYPVGLDVVDVNPGVSFNRDACLELSVAPSASFQCGELRYVYPLPSVRTYNKSRTPTLVYNSRAAIPFQPISALLTIAPPTGKTLAHVTGKLYAAQHGVAGSRMQVASGTWPGTDWGSLTTATTRRIQLLWDQRSGTGTGLYDYTFTTVRTYSDNSLAQDSVNGQYIVGPLGDYEFGNGWWVAGLEHITVVDSALAWYGGDGNSQLYTPCGTNLWCPWNPNNTFGVSAIPQAYVDGRDSIMFDGKAYTRYVPHGGRVVFDGSSGYDTASFDRLGHKTQFRYDSTFAPNLRLKKIIIPTPSNDAAMYYQFFYTDTHFTFDSISAPYTNGTRRIIHVRSQWLVQTMEEAHLAFYDPDGDSTLFNWSTASHDSAIVLQSVVDKRGTNISFTFAQDHGMLTSATINMQGTGANITRTFTTPGFGLAAPDIPGPHAVIPDSAFIVLHGPRSQVSGDSADTARFWVDYMWQPLRIRDAHGYETLIAYGNLESPTLPLRIEYPNQRVLTFIHGDGRGNVTQVIDSGMVINHVVATTNAAYDAHWDFPTLIDPPLHDSISVLYDGFGNDTATHNARGTATKTTYHYNAYNLLSSTVLPQTASDSVQYDTDLGNLSAFRTPLGFWTLHHADALGRDSLVITPINAADIAHDPGMTYPRDTVVTQYDVMDRQINVLSVGPGANRQTITVTTSYDPEGAVQSVQQTPFPDTAHISHITTSYFHDRAGRLSYTIHPNSSKDSTYYDAAGNADTVYTRRGFKIVQTFDALNRLISRSLPPAAYTILDTVGVAQDPLLVVDNEPYGGFTVPGDLQTFSYDPLGRMLEADNTAAHVSRSYDANGHLTSETQRVTTLAGGNYATHIYALANTYDRDGRRTGLTLPAQVAPSSTQNTITFGYDSAGQRDTVRTPLGAVLTYRYTPRGDPDTLFRPNHVFDARRWDDDGRLVSHVVGQPGATQRNETFTYDARDKLDTSSNAAGVLDTASFTYSTIGNLTSSDVIWNGFAVSGEAVAPDRVHSTETFSDDPLGNRVLDASTVTFGSVVSERRGAIWHYVAGTGQLAAHYEPATTDTMKYDASGNTYIAWTQFQPQAIPLSDRATYYGADENIARVDHRIVDSADLAFTGYHKAIEDYFYDALGRRVMVHSARTCERNYSLGECNVSFVRRTIWDGSEELAEIQVPDSAATLENDAAVVNFNRSSQLMLNWDGNLDYGRVVYTPGLGVDEPIAVTRLDYTSESLDDNNYQSSIVSRLEFAPFEFLPLWNYHGQMYNAVFGDGTAFHCTTAPEGQRCAIVNLLQGWVPYNARLSGPFTVWNGSLMENKEDKAGTLYRRARAYDPLTGRFTQEDPLGLAGGLNLYGFAAGDPVNYSDPFGLCPKDLGGDGKTRSISDCPIGSKGHALWNRKAGGGIEEGGLGDPIGWFTGGAEEEGAEQVVRAAAADAFEVAAAGGRNAGLLANYTGKAATELESGIASLEQNVADHLSWIKDPTKKVADFFSRDIREQRGLLNKWLQDAARNQSQANILRGLLQRLQ